MDIYVDNYVDFHQCSCRKYVAQRTHDALIIHAYVGNLLVKNLDFFCSTTERSREHVENMLWGVVCHWCHHKEEVALSL